MINWQNNQGIDFNKLTPCNQKIKKDRKKDRHSKDPIKRAKRREWSRIYMAQKRASIRAKKTFDELPNWKQKRILSFWKCFDKGHSRFANTKKQKKCLIKGWNQRFCNSNIAKIIKSDKNAMLVLENKSYPYPVYDGNYVGVIDIDVKGFTALFPHNAYTSNRIGSVHFYFLYKNKLPNNTTHTLNRQNVKDCKFDFKVNGFTYLPGSIHSSSGNLYDLKRSFGKFFINNNQSFENQTEAYEFVKNRIEKFVQYKQMIKTQRSEQKQYQTNIEVPTVSEK